MFDDLKKRVVKVGQPPGTPVYTGDSKNSECKVFVLHYSGEVFQEFSGSDLEKCLPAQPQPGITWIRAVGLNNSKLLDDIAKRYQLHPLTVEDILNVQQRPKVEEFPTYYFTTLKMISWDKKANDFFMQQISLVFGEGFVISFQEQESSLFDSLIQRLRANPMQNMRQQSSDYLAYRLIDTVIDQYFIVLEGVSDQIEKIEGFVIRNPSTKNARHLQRLKRQILLLRKAIWPMREAVSHLLRDEGKLISAFTHVYLRDLYDHTVQALDTLELFREMISSILDVYLSSLTNRMNEIMKVLTIIATIFIPITFVASVYGMNFKYMPELSWHWGYPAVLGLMLVVSLIMLYYFKRKKWL